MTFYISKYRVILYRIQTQERSNSKISYKSRHFKNESELPPYIPKTPQSQTACMLANNSAEVFFLQYQCSACYHWVLTEKKTH